MNEYRFTSALEYTFEEMSEMHQSSFSGYFVPFTTTPALYADFWRFNQIDATRCVVMHDRADAFVGMARMGTRGTRGWCGGFGIVPAFRGRGASYVLAEEMVRVARETGLTRLQLEVLNQNVAARKTYEHVGFTARRRLFGLEYAVAQLPTETITTATAAIAVVPPTRVSVETLLSWPQSDIIPCWSLELASLLTIQPATLLLPGPDGLPNAFLVQYTEGIARILMTHLQSTLTRNEFATLLRTVAGDATTIQTYNEPENSPILQRYLELGFTEYFSQYEMFLDL